MSIMFKDFFKFITDSVVVSRGIKEGVAAARKSYLDTDKINQSSFDALVNIDPTPQKKYIEWMVKTFVNGKLHHLDVNKYGIIKDFNSLVDKNVIKNKDINSYENIEKVYDEVKKHEDVKTKGDIERAVKKEGTKVVFENDKVLVVIPLTRESSCFYGKGTKWCTSGDVYNYFNDYFYNKGVNLYYVIPKTGKNEDKMAVAVYKSGKRTYYDAVDNTISSVLAKNILNKLGISI